MTAKVVAICLDAAEPWVIDHYVERGRLPNLARLREAGAYGHTQNLGIYKAEPAFTTVMAGVWPFETGYWGRIVYHADKLDVREYGTYDFKEFPMFWEMGPDFKVCAFDLPQAELSEKLNGIEVVAWGAHSPRRGRGSNPAYLYDEIIEKYGPHPALNSDNNNIYCDKEARQLKEELLIGIDRRRRISLDLLAREDWDLFLTTFGEVHAAQHQYWHYVFDHPLHEVMAEDGRDDLGDILAEVDAALGEIEAAAGDNTTMILYAAHGMMENRADLCSGAFLAEMMYRWNFGEPALASCPEGTAPPAPSLDYPRHMKHEVWDLVTPEGRKRLTSPRDQEAMGMSLNWQPTNWYKSAWKDMRAFALPSYSDGYVRLNVKGRDKGGRITPDEYATLCDELESYVRSWRCARTGKPVVESVARPRQDALANDPKLPDADLVIGWSAHAATDIVEADGYGQIGPVPFFRTADHTTNGFVIAKGPGIEAGQKLGDGEAIDFAPTILKRVGATVPPYMKGRDLLAS